MTPQESPPTTQELLEGYQHDALRAMAVARGIEGARWTKGEVVALLVRHLQASDSNALAATVSDLGESAAAALGLLQRSGDVASREVIETMLVRQGTLRQSASRRPTRWSTATGRTAAGDRAMKGTFEEIMTRLELHGFALGLRPARASRLLDPGEADWYVIPEEIRPKLPAVPAPASPSTPVVAREVLGDAAVLSRELYLLFGHVWRRQPALNRQLRLTKRALKALLPQIGGPVDPQPAGDEAEMPRLWFLRSLLAQLRLIRPTQSTPSTAVLSGDLAAARTWWAKSLAERTRDCLEAWLAARWWNELAWLSDVAWSPDHPDALVSAPPEIVSARGKVLRALARVAAGSGWTSVLSATDELFLTQRDFLVPAEAPPAYSGGYGPSRYSSYGNRKRWSFHSVSGEPVGWETVEVGFVKAVVNGLGWLGLVDRGVDEAGALTVYRFTDLAHRILGDRGGEIDVAESGGRVVVQPNFRVMAMGPVPERDLLELEVFAERRSVDVALEFELTRDSVYRGQLAGLDADAILRRLRAMASADPPQNVARTITEWQARHERIVVRRGARVLQAADAALLDLVLEALSKEPGEHQAVRLTPEVARLPLDPDAARALESCLLTLGRTPRLADDADTSNSVILLADGEARPIQHCPTLQVLGRLQRIAEHDEETGTFRLTRAGVRRALGDWDLDADAQCREWAALVRPPAPDWLAQRVKTWSGHYGRARLSRPILLEFADEETLNDLQHHPGLEGRLTAVGTRGLALVAPDDLDAVLQTLADLGVELTEEADAPGASHPPGGAGPAGSPRRGAAGSHSTGRPRKR